MIVTCKDDGNRLDSTLVTHIENCSRTSASELIKKGFLLVNNKIKKPGYRVKTGEKLQGTIPRPSPLPDCYPENLPLEIIFQDPHLIIINKQPGIVVHPSPGHSCGTLVNALLYHCPDIEGVGGAIRPGIVHRLDKDTSGIMVIAKTHYAHTAISSLFKSRDIKKEYIGLVYGNIKEKKGRITLPIGRHPFDRKKMSVNSKRPRSAETIWSVNKHFGDVATLLDIQIKTGRTHQIRVHFASMHHPIIGDCIYGSRKLKNIPTIYNNDIQKKIKTIPRQMLHAHSLSFKHPISGETLNFTAPIPEDMNKRSSIRAMINIAFSFKGRCFACC
ncbi:MAG: hypothetical protein B6I31_03155 [Desulfobacteraceae bacterium 4572_19]|nr:MAG: hypothetical protein B6I31_03155 [Desulfobacteraceae bacterium 4572_19]